MPGATPGSRTHHRSRASPAPRAACRPGPRRPPRRRSDEATPAVTAGRAQTADTPSDAATGEAERGPPRAAAPQHPAHRERTDDEGVGPADTAGRQPDGRRPDRGAPRAHPQARDEQVGHGGVPEQHGPLAHDEPLQDERVPDRGDRGHATRGDPQPRGQVSRASRAAPVPARTRMPHSTRAWAGPAPSSQPRTTPAASLGTARGAGVLVPRVNGVSRGSGDQARS